MPGFQILFAVNKKRTSRKCAKLQELPLQGEIVVLGRHSGNRIALQIHLLSKSLEIKQAMILQLFKTDCNTN